MSEPFEASNGYTVRRDQFNELIVDGPKDEIGKFWSLIAPAEQATALREFFQAERDRELGRWRDPEDPDMVVYRRTCKAIAVVDERDGNYIIEIMEDSETPPLEGTPAIYWTPYRYFQAHPEPKPEPRPWENAKPGEVWLLRIEGVKDFQPALVARGEFVFDAGYMSLKSINIRMGHRIWPEKEVDE